MAELSLSQSLKLCDILETDDYQEASKLALEKDMVNQIEKENNLISQSAILDAVNSREKLGINLYEEEYLVKSDPLRFALVAVRIGIHLQNVTKYISEIAKLFVKRKLPSRIFYTHELLNRTLSRLATAIGMVVEFLVEEKEDFYGSIQDIHKELETYYQKLQSEFIRQENFNYEQISVLSIIIHNIQQINDIVLELEKELTELSSGKDLESLNKYKIQNTILS